MLAVLPNLVSLSLRIEIHNTGGTKLPNGGEDAIASSMDRIISSKKLTNLCLEKS
jgi:hypothetical protein